MSKRPILKVSPSGELYASESSTQIAAVRLFRTIYPEHANRLFAIPNGGARGGKVSKTGKNIQAAIMKAEGVTPGVPDLLLAFPAFGFAGLFIEMKTPVGTLEPEQREILEDFASVGYAVVVCRSLGEFEKAVSLYLSGAFIQTPVWAYKRKPKKLIK